MWILAIFVLCAAVLAPLRYACNDIFTQSMNYALQSPVMLAFNVLLVLSVVVLVLPIFVRKVRRVGKITLSGIVTHILGLLYGISLLIIGLFFSGAGVSYFREFPFPDGLRALYLAAGAFFVITSIIRILLPKKPFDKALGFLYLIPMFLMVAGLLSYYILSTTLHSNLTYMFKIVSGGFCGIFFFSYARLFVTGQTSKNLVWTQASGYAAALMFFLDIFSDLLLVDLRGSVGTVFAVMISEVLAMIFILFVSVRITRSNVGAAIPEPEDSTESSLNEMASLFDLDAESDIERAEKKSPATDPEKPETSPKASL